MATVGRQFVVLSADFTTTGTNPGWSQHGGSTSDLAEQVTGFAFTPEASTRYYMEGVFICRSSTALTTAGRPGLSMPTGLDARSCYTLFGEGAINDNAATWFHWYNMLVETQRGGVIQYQHTNSDSYPVFLRGWFQTGASPVGDVQVVYGPETLGVSVTLKAGSFIAYYQGYTGQT